MSATLCGSRSRGRGLGLLALLVLTFGCARQDRQPAFLLRDERRSNEVLAVFVTPQKLRQHHLTAAQYETLLRSLGDATLTAAVSVAAEMLGASRTAPAVPTQQIDKTDPILSAEAFEDLVGHTRLETWRMNPDGTHEVLSRTIGIGGNQGGRHGQHGND